MLSVGGLIAHLSEFGVTVSINAAVPSAGAGETGDRNRTILQFHT